MKSGHACESVSHSARDMNLNHRLTLASCVLKPESGSQYHGPGCLEVSELLCNGSSDQSELENFMSHCHKGEADGTVISEDDSRSLPSSTVEDEDDLTPEIRQAYRIFQSFLSEKHKATTAPFWHPVGPGSQGDRASDGEMCFKKMDDKFVNREYESITAFVADFRLMLENCYRFHGVHHWMSKQAQKLEMILEQKLTLLSRTLREKTTLAVTSKGRFGTEDEKGPAGASSRRRSVPRSLAAITVGGSESILVQALRLEELQRAKEEKRQRELEKKEAEEVSVKEMEEWERSLLSLADPWSVRTMWELPAIGHFLCLAQTALNLPEIVFYELERCLLMPRCSSFLSKVMTSLLCPSHKRPTLHRRPPLPYRKWEAELRRRVQGWYQAVGRSEDQVGRAEHLGLCHQFFWTVGEMNPLEETPFHLLPFNRRVWLLKGLCDHVYEMQKDVQDAVLGQPIHECRESILGYDGQENAYIHFPHFCGADLRIYRQSPCLEMEFPLPLFHVKRSEEEKKVVKDEMNKGSFLYVDAVKVENDSSGDVEMCAWGLQDDSLHDGEELDQKCPSGVHLHCKEDSGGIQEKSMKLKHLEEEKESDIEPCFRVGDSCYKGKSPALSLRTDDVTQQTVDEKRLCAECSEASPHLCTHCQTICKDHVQPEINIRRDRSKGTTDTTKRKKRKKKSEFSARKTNTGKLNIKARRLKKHLHRVDNIRKKKQKLRRKLNVKIVSVKRKTGPVEPSFQLVCSSLDDLRALISRTEDELDQINSTKKRSVRWQHKRSTVKELHITLVRLLNELLPWEPKLVKAFQKNRARMKKESDDFKKHPEYENFTREQMDSSEDLSFATETTREPEDAEVKAVRTLTEDPDVTEHPNQFESHKSRCPDDRPEVIMMGNETGPFTRASKRRHINAVNEEQSTFKRAKMEPESSSSLTPNMGALNSDPTTANPQEPPERASGLSEPVRSVQGTYKHIQALLAKSVGNKVTLINHPNTTVIAQRLDKTSSSTHQPVQTLSTHSPITQLEPVCTVTQTSKPENTGAVVYKTAGGLGLLKKGGTSVKFSVQPIPNHKPGEKVTQQVFILPSNLLIQSTEIKAAQQSPDLTSVSVPCTTNTVPENKVPVQQVTPLKETSEVRTPCAAVLPSLRTLPTNTGGSIVPKKTEPKVVPNISTTKPDAKQELRTVCIRDSQSILVTTRGGNTGVVKVQTSEQSGTLTPSPVFAISPQLKAFLVSKSSASTTQTVPGAIAPVMNSESLSRDIIPVSSTEILTSSVLNQTLSSDSTSTLLTGKPLLFSSSKSSDSVRLTVKDVHKVQQNTGVMKSGSRPSNHQSTFQKVFLVGPSTNLTSAATKITTTTATCTVPGSRVMFINHSPDNSTRVIPKGVPFTSPALEALKIIPNLHSCTTSGPVTNIQSISLSGLTSSRILGTSTKTTPVIVPRVTQATSMSSGLQNRSSESVNSENLLKAAGSVEGKTFSTLGTGHMASSELLSVVKHDTSVSTPVSVLNALNSKTGLVVGSSVSDISSSFSGSFLSKHTTLPLHCVTARKPQTISSLCTSPSSINTCTAGLSHQTSNISTLTSPGVMTSGMRPPNSEKIVINTSAPLAPGTQLLINNTRLVVPPQGLGPGSHVLLISNSSHGIAPSPPRGLNASGPFQGMKTQQTLLRLPSPTTAKAGVHQQVNIITSRSSPPVPQPLHAGVSSEQAGLANIVRFPIFHTSDGKGLVVTPSHHPSETSVVCSLPQGPLLNTTSARPPPHNQVVPAVRTVISQNAPVVTRAPMNSTISRMQKLPVATVPPVGCLNVSSEVTPVATVPPSMNTVIMTRRQPIRAVQPGAYGNPVILHQQPQTQSKSVVQITSGALTNSTAGKLLLSPDGAILNIVQASTPSNVEVPGKPMRAHVDVPNVSRVTVPVLNTKTDHPKGLNH